MGPLTTWFRESHIDPILVSAGEMDERKVKELLYALAILRPEIKISEEERLRLGMDLGMGGMLDAINKHAR